MYKIVVFFLAYPEIYYIIRTLNILPHPYICLIPVDTLTVYDLRKGPYTDHFMQWALSLSAGFQLGRETKYEYPML